MKFHLASIFFVLLLSCNQQEPAVVQSATPPSSKYYFFPKANVYVDSVNQNYVFLAGDGKSWLTQKQIPAAMQPMMDKGVLIEQPSQPVWKDNENHKLVYSALLYATANDTVEKKPEPKPKSAPPKREAEPKKEKKGLGKFIDKIFKRNKDKN